MTPQEYTCTETADNIYLQLKMNKHLCKEFNIKSNKWTVSTTNLHDRCNSNQLN